MSGEVLDKRVVVQHFVFSKHFPATWTPSTAERVAPTETFRSGHTAATLPVTRAPWATSSDTLPVPRSLLGDRDSPDLSPTRAPWADDEDDNDRMLPTKAPWAT